jgi:hypothetical protein
MLRLITYLSAALLLTSCAAGDSSFAPESPAGFWYGLWHGVISFISLVIHIFNDHVVVYEVNNTGGWYDFGFLLGVILVWGGSSHVSCKTAARRKRDQEWEEIGEKVEIKIKRKLKEWADDEDLTEGDEEWKDVSDKVEKKLKRKLREWAEKE